MSLQENLVGLPSDKLGLVLDFVGKLRSQNGFEQQAILFLSGKDPFAVPVKDAKREIEKFAAKTARKLSKIFKKRIIVDPIPPEFTDKRLAFWATFNMKPVFLPDEEIGIGRVIKDWKKPEKWFYEQVVDGKVKPIHENLPPTKLRHGWYLADFTTGTDYTDGNQTFVNDPLSPVIRGLREKKLVGWYDNTPLGSRFAIAPNEWQDVVLAHVASKFCVTRAQTRLERAIEFNAVGNLYDPNRGKFNYWEWFEDSFEDSDRLFGGHRGYGGLADVDHDDSGYREGPIAGRPLVSFVS